MGADDPNRQRARRHALRAHLAQADLAALLVTKLANVRYLTGFSGSYGALLLLHDRTLFFTDRRYERHAAARVEEAELVLAPGGLIGAVAGVLGPLDEGLGSETFDELVGTLRPGVTEREVAIDLELGMRRRGAEALAFDSIVAFGEQAAEPHHRPGDRPLRRGDLIKLDFGARVDGYCSDMTRTVVVGPASATPSAIPRAMASVWRSTRPPECGWVPRGPQSAGGCQW